MWKLSLVTLATLLLAVGCSSKKKEEKLVEVDNTDTIQLDYEVKEASSMKRPTWVESASQWADETEGKEPEKFRYLSFQTEPKVSREIACNLARANIKTDIAGEIVTFIQKELGVSKEGQASIDANNPETKPMREFVEETLVEKIQSLINGASVVNTYWEKRQYLQSKGAKKDYIGYTCASLIRIEHERLKMAVEEAAKKVIAKADDPETKENVKKALENASVNFEKARKGEI
ncbi:MAG: hypothetical protein ACOYL6_00290 [Bacteriovoracaceae bacterium]